MTPVAIRAMRAEHAKQVLAIYQAGMDAGNASFEHTAPDWTAFDASKLPGYRYVAGQPTGLIAQRIPSATAST